jgi:hypothetical protein
MLVKAEGKHKKKSMQLVNTQIMRLERNVNRREPVNELIQTKTYAGIGGFEVPFWY